jgi:hypothetical protein
MAEDYVEGHMPEDKFLVVSRKGKRLGVAFALHAPQPWLGHKNIQHTVRYTELAPSPCST